MKFLSSGSAGRFVAVGGMVGRDEAGGPVAGLVPQTIRALDRAEAALGEHGLDRTGIIRLRIYLTDVADWPAVRDALAGWFGPVLPAATVLGGVQLVEEWMLVEIEADAAAPG